MWAERIKWWLWGRRRALGRPVGKVTVDARYDGMNAEMAALLSARLHKPPDWIAAYYVDDPAKCYDMRSVAELLGERK